MNQPNGHDDEIIECEIGGIHIRGPRSVIDNIEVLGIPTDIDSDDVEAKLAEPGELWVPIDLALQNSARQPEDTDPAMIDAAVELMNSCPEHLQPEIKYFLPDSWATGKPPDR